MKDAIFLMGSSKDISRLIANEMCQPPTEPSRQEEFEHIVMSFIYDQEERIKQLENYMQDITDEFMELSLEVTLRIKERIKENESKPRKIEEITKYPDTKVLENSTRQNFLENLGKKTFSTPASHLCNEQKIKKHKGATLLILQDFYRRESLKARGVRIWSTPNALRYSLSTLSPSLNGETSFELMSLSTKNWFIGGEQRDISLLEFGWRVGLYSQGQSMEDATLSRLRDCNIVREDRLLMEFWPCIGNGVFNVGNTKVASIRDPRVKLAHRCIATTIAARKKQPIESPKLIFIISTVSIPLRIARSFGLLTNEWRGALSVEPQPHVFKKKSLIAMGMIMKLYGGMCIWPRAMAEEEEDDEGDYEEAGGDAGQGEAGGSADLYRSMSQGDWQAHQTHWMG
ncbi:hypothetical protein Tco_1466856 [Tanacetum coccineum]